MLETMLFLTAYEAVRKPRVYVLATLWDSDDKRVVASYWENGVQRESGW